MKFPVYITLSPGGDRPYVSTTPPSRERIATLKEQGCEFYEGLVEIPGWELRNTRLIRAEPLVESTDGREQSVTEF